MDPGGLPSDGKLPKETLAITSTEGRTLSQAGHFHSRRGGYSSAERGDPECACPPSKHAVVFVGLLCSLVLTAMVTVCVHYYKASFSCGLLKTESQGLRNNFDTARAAANHYILPPVTSRAQRSHNVKERIRKKLSDQTSLMNHLQGELQNMISIREQLSGELLNNSGAHAHLKRVYRKLVETKNKLFADVVSLSEMKALVNKDLVAIVRERDNLKMLTELVNFLPVDRHCPIRDPVTQERVCSPCLKGWKLFSSKCYYFSTERRAWDRSRVDCVKHGGDLVIIDSPEEQDFVHRHTPQYHSPAERYWIGLDSQEAPGVWIWVDNTRLGEGYWVNESSGVHASRDKECVSTLREADPARSWKEEVCSSKFRWICEGSALILAA